MVAGAPVALSRIYNGHVPEGPPAPAAMLLPSVEDRGAQPRQSAAARPTRARFAPPASVSTKGFSWPVAGAHVITSPFGPRDDGFHHGTDIGCAVGQPIFSMRGGKIRFAAEARAYGNVVLIDHGRSYQTVYSHLDRLDVKPGQHVGARQLLGTCGETGNATGPHLHLEVRYGGYVYDPLTFLP